MATRVDNLREWAGDKGYVAMVYDDVTLAISEFRYANGSTRGPAYVWVYDKRGRLMELQNGVGYTLMLPPGSPEQTWTPPANANLGLNPEDGSVNGWRIVAQGPAS